MAVSRTPGPPLAMSTLRSIPVLLLLAAGLAPLAPLDAQAGPILRRAQERKACQEFAGKLQATSGNPQQAQLVYQQGVLKLVETFGENPAPVASAPAPAPAAAVSPVTAPSSAKSANPQQAQACQEFAGKLQGAQGNPAQAQQIYAMGTQKLSGMFGPNPCPNVPKP